ncbi:MAG: AAA family ATPase [Anaerolineae bacterium]|nr:AAA family ATPase [Anaerolineae bacterium]
MKHLTLSLLGTFQATLDERTLSNFRSSKVQGLLVYLALNHDEPHSRDVLATFFWSDDPESIARQNLRQSLYQLRQVLGDMDSANESYLVVTRSSVQFNADSHFSLDVNDFLSYLENDQLESAITLYRGDLLSGFTCDSPQFDEWLRQERERLHRLALDTLFTLTVNSIEYGDYQKAQSLARRQLTLEPWREEAHQQLIRALALHGERSVALAQYEICRTILAEELGIEPSAETQTLVGRIRKQQLAQPNHTKQQYVRLTIPFVGRHTEYASLVKVYEQMTSKGMQVVMLSGKAGIGKSRLTQQFLEWARIEGADVLQGRAFEMGTGLSYQPITHAFRQRIERENAPEDLLSDLWLSQLTRILPELRDRYPDLPEPIQEENTARQHLFEAIARLGQALAERAPLLLFIDDWHWADAASLDVMQYAIQRWSEEKTPILALLTLREEVVAESPDLQGWLTRFKRDIALEQLNLNELSLSETEQLIKELIDSQTDNDDILNRFSHWLFEETDGQPLFLTETLKVMVEEGLLYLDPNSKFWQVDRSRINEQQTRIDILPTVQQVIQGWLKRITPSAGDLLVAVSVLAEQASFDNIYRVAGLEETVALTALDELLSKQLLSEGNESLASLAHDPLYRFSHQKVREVIYNEAGTVRRRIFHRRAFDTLQKSNAPAAELAHHALHAGLVAETIRYSLVAGNEAMALFAFKVAISHFETAFQIAEHKGWSEEISGADQQALYTSLGRAYELADQWQQALEVYQSMIDYAQTIDAPAMECLGLNHLATVYLHGIVDFPKALAILEQARSVAEQNEDRRGLAETEWNLSMAAIHEEKLLLALHHGERAVTLARELEHPQLLARSLTSLGQVYSLQRQWEKGEIYTYESQQLYIAAGNLVLAANSQRGLGFIKLFLGRPLESLAMLQETSAFSQKIENVWGQADSAWMLARIHLELGNYGEAIRLSRQAVEQTDGLGPPLFHRIALAAWGIVQRTIMNWDAAESIFLELRDKPSEETARLTDFASELCTLHAQSGNWNEAHNYAKEAISNRDEQVLPSTFTGYYETEALLRGGDIEMARSEVGRLGELVGDNRRYKLILHRCKAILAQWGGVTGEAIFHLQVALAIAQDIGLPGEAWSILHVLGDLYMDQGEQAKAQQSFKAAATIILRLAETIDEDDIKKGFLAAKSIRSILELSKMI